MLVRTFDPSTESVVEWDLDSEDEIRQLILADSTDIRTLRGRPALELVHGDSSLLMGWDGERAVLMWTDQQGASFHSVGNGTSHPTLVFDYYGSYTEVPGDVIITRTAAIEAAIQFFRSGRPNSEDVVFEPD